jgi:hypothetical protein
VVFVRVHRHAIEVLAKAPDTAKLNRQEVEVAFEDTGSGGDVDVHRHAVEALSKFPATAKLNRQEIEVAFEDDGSGGDVDVHRHVVEVLSKAPGKAGLARQEIEVAFEDAGSGGDVNIHRHIIEILGRRAVPPITPLAFPTGLDFFLHNWVSGISMETRYLTDITRAATTLAEERRGLLERPQRQVKITPPSTRTPWWSPAAPPGRTSSTGTSNTVGISTAVGWLSSPRTRGASR